MLFFMSLTIKIVKLNYIKELINIIYNNTTNKMGINIISYFPIYLLLLEIFSSAHIGCVFI